MSGLDSAQMIGLALIALALASAIWSTIVKRRDERRRKIQAAKRRHPSARTTMSERERRYHGSDQLGR